MSSSSVPLMVSLSNHVAVRIAIVLWTASFRRAGVNPDEL